MAQDPNWLDYRGPVAKLRNRPTDSTFSRCAFWFGWITPIFYFVSIYLLPSVVTLGVSLGVAMIGVVVIAAALTGIARREPKAWHGLVGVFFVSSPLWLGYVLYLTD